MDARSCKAEARVSLNIRFAEKTAVSLTGSYGFPGIIAITRDISERKRAEQALRQSEQKFSIFFNKAAFAASLSSLPAGAMLNVNEAFERAFGYTKQEVMGRSTLELGINPDLESRKRILAALEEHGSVR